VIRHAVCFLALADAVFAGEGLSFKGFPEFRNPQAEIVWVSRPRNPASLWIYKVVPQTYSPSTISNFMALGSFTDADRIQNDSTLRFRSDDKSKNLEIIPANGWVRYWDNQADSTYKKEIEGVPNNQEVERKALELLARFGIERTNLALRPGTSRPIGFGTQISSEHFSKTQSNRVTDIINRGVMFVRAIDGVSFTGTGIGGGTKVNFGLRGQLQWFEIVWRNLQPFERGKVASPDEISRWIKDGRAVMTHRNYVNPKDVKKLTITDCAPLYMGCGGNVKQAFVYPFAQLEAIADLGYTNSPLQLYCPILSN
jgi:hypothetical protein